MDAHQRLACALDIRDTVQPLLREAGDIFDSLSDVTYERQRDMVSSALTEAWSALQTIVALCQMVVDHPSDSHDIKA